MVRWFGAAFEDSIRSRMAELKVPGCAVAVIEGGQVALIRCYGVTESTTDIAVTPATRFSLQSVSKSMAAWAIMKLHEENRLDLDAPISRYLRSWTLPPSDEFDLELVTPRRLLSHHGGITTAGFRGVELYRTSVTLIDGMNASLPEPTKEQEAHWAYWKLPEPEPVCVRYPPGGEWHYSNAGFALLEIALEDITGQTYADFVQKNIFDPLNMTDAGFSIDAVRPHAKPHDRDGRPTKDYRWLSGAAAGVYATINDLASFACSAMDDPQGQVAGRGVLEPKSIRTMYSSHGAADQSSGAPFEAGLGHVLLKENGRLNVHHSGGSIGWRSVFSIFPDSGNGICMLMNSEAANELWVPLVREWRDAEASDRVVRAND